MTQDNLSLTEKRNLIDIISQKKSGLIDKDWSEICADFNLDINTETLRKAGVGIKLAMDANIGSEKSLLNNVSGGYLERQKIRDLTSTVNDMYRAEARSELLRETISEAVKGLRDICPPVHLVTTKGSSNKSLVLAVGDFHYGASIHVEGLYNDTLNHYDHTVFKDRMEVLLSETVAILEKESIDQVYLFMVGDLIDGMLRQSQLVRLEYGIVESVMRLSEYLSQWIAALSAYAEVQVYASTGNHSEIRPLKSKSREFEDENLERIIMWFIHSRLSGVANIYVDADCKRMVVVDVEDYNFLLLHGDGEKDIEKIARDTVNLYGHTIDFFVCGHKHKETEIPSGMTGDGNSIVVRVPSICGVDRYAQSKGYGGSAGATAMVIEKGYGRRCVYPIRLA